MKKLLLSIIGCAVLTACNMSQSGDEEKDRMSREVDSLKSVISHQQDDFDNLLGEMNDITQGFARISEAEGRVNVLSDNAENSDEITVNIQENMDFIATTLRDNRKKIEDLQNRLKQSNIKSANLQNMISDLARQLKVKDAEIDDLHQQLSGKDIIIRELDESVSALKEENEEVKAESESNAQIVRNQDAQINTAWYVIGTKSELKDKKILEKGEVLTNGDFDKSYFTKVDIRNFTELPLNSKSVEILTIHPKNAYSLTKDSHGMYTLHVLDAARFWETSKYLVIRVR